ncbi:MAG TPA: TolC family protein [Candidatus Acidoferrales bacterium]|nr:TolC family protein [Candidatus Acidoferrales bacterium]
MRKALALAAAMVTLPVLAAAQQKGHPPEPPRADTSKPPVTKLTLDDAIRIAVEHNHALQAARSTILQNQAQETTANLRPNPTISWDTQFFPLFQPSEFSLDYLNNQAQFDIGVGYLFERGKKRQHRLQAAKDATAVTRATVSDNERTLIFNVGSQFISSLLAESTLEFAQQDYDSFQNTVQISEARFKAGDISQGDLLKIKLQLLQFQTDLLNAKVAKVQALAGLRQLLGFESVPDNFEVEGELAYQPVKPGLDGLKALALENRPDLKAAHLGVTAAQSQAALAVANGKRDLSATFSYTHTAGVNSGAFFFNIDLPIFDRNQGEIARTRYAITQAEEQQTETSQQVLTDVVDAYANLHTNDQVVHLYQDGYIDAATQSRDISQYSYEHGVASLLDYLDAERTYRASQLAYRQALANYMTALEQMREAVGTRNLP